MKEFESIAQKLDEFASLRSSYDFSKTEFVNIFPTVSPEATDLFIILFFLLENYATDQYAGGGSYLDYLLSEMRFSFEDRLALMNRVYSNDKEIKNFPYLYFSYPHEAERIHVELTDAGKSLLFKNLAKVTAAEQEALPTSLVRLESIKESNYFADTGIEFYESILSTYENLFSRTKTNTGLVLGVFGPSTRQNKNFVWQLAKHSNRQIYDLDATFFRGPHFSFTSVISIYLAEYKSIYKFFKIKPILYLDVNEFSIEVRKSLGEGTNYKYLKEFLIQCIESETLVILNSNSDLERQLNPLVSLSARIELPKTQTRRAMWEELLPNAPSDKLNQLASHELSLMDIEQYVKSALLISTENNGDFVSIILKRIAAH